MADDSIEIVEPFDFHPCSSPRGMLYYDLNILTASQQVELNDFKRNLTRENERYLARHPEVRAVVALTTRHVLQVRPRSNLHEFVGQYFSRPKPDIQEDINKYVEDREPHIYEGDSAVIIREESSEEPSEAISFSFEDGGFEEEESLDAVPRKVLNEILETAYARLGIDVDNMDESLLPEMSDSDTTTGSVVNKVITEILKTSDAGSEFGEMSTATSLEERASGTEASENTTSEVGTIGDKRETRQVEFEEIVEEEIVIDINDAIFEQEQQ